MTERRSRFSELALPRGLTGRDVAHYLGLSEGGFSKLKPRLRREGFPDPDPLIGRYDRNAIDSWLDGRNELYEGSSDPGLTRRLEELRNGKVQGATPH